MQNACSSKARWMIDLEMLRFQPLRGSHSPLVKELTSDLLTDISPTYCIWVSGCISPSLIHTHTFILWNPTSHKYTAVYVFAAICCPLCGPRKGTPSWPQRKLVQQFICTFISVFTVQPYLGNEEKKKRILANIYLYIYKKVLYIGYLATLYGRWMENTVCPFGCCNVFLQTDREHQAFYFSALFLWVQMEEWRHLWHQPLNDYGVLTNNSCNSLCLQMPP